MNRTLTAAVALAATLGVAGWAQAQSYAPGTTGGTTPGATTTMPPQTPVPAPQTTAPYTTATPPGGTTGGMTSGGLQAGTQGSQANMQPGAQPRVSAATIQQAQEQLKSQGLYNGPIDGMLGPQMKTALSQFQQRNGLRQSAMLDQETLNRLVGQGGQNGQGGEMPPATSPGTTR